MEEIKIVLTTILAISILIISIAISMCLYNKVEYKYKQEMAKLGYQEVQNVGNYNTHWEKMYVE